MGWVRRRERRKILIYKTSTIILCTADGNYQLDFQYCYYLSVGPSGTYFSNYLCGALRAITTYIQCLSNMYVLAFHFFFVLRIFTDAFFLFLFLPILTWKSVSKIKAKENICFISDTQISSSVWTLALLTSCPLNGKINTHKWEKMHLYSF